jgi:hypothetical protein
VIDMIDLQWWQSAAVILGALGLSPAPWILGLALGRIQFTAPATRAFEARVADLKESHAQAIAELVKHQSDIETGWNRGYAELKDSRDYYRDARIDEAKARREATDQLTAVASEAAKIAAIALATIGENDGKGPDRDDSA